MLRRILKIITEQSEFQIAMQKSKYFVPKISYADTYFIRHVDRITQEDYIPTLQDILVMRQPSKAIRETLTLIGTTVVRTVDLAEQSHYLHKHLHYFESVDTVMFIVPLSNRLFSNQPAEAESELEASVRLFETIVTSPHMLKKDYVVFFNKLDLLRSEIEEASSDDIASVCEDRVATVVDNWKQRFFAFKHKPDSKDCRMISIYVICALDVDQMKSVMRDCLRGIFDLHRKRHVLL
ncbi:hypothetical protein EG68_04409 [Paragonimus skrjabini miyazakii]|uniref:Uncharacterized protein n=1 Tax=Paragonimus skrjabini miyazakii TaxID=59628 RepID=A0A8S9YUR9_9TREM|nr:hypothetical protein EG68_04409 [Paragonimus skrjabini miyazakii]